MKTTRRPPVTPPKSIVKALSNARKNGSKVVFDSVTLTPPSAKSKSWRLRVSINGLPKEKKARDNDAEIYAALIALNAEIESLQLGAMGLPENSNDFLAETIGNYISQGGPNSNWDGKTPKNRREDFAHLIKMARKEKLKCSDINASVVRRFLNEATGSPIRAKTIIGVIRTFVQWGIGTGFFTQSQYDSIKTVVWSPPKGSNYKAPRSRREQSKIHFGTQDRLGGVVPSHDQVVDMAEELQKHYKFGRALVHVSANLGTRANETLVFTASREVHEKGLGNLVDLADDVVRVKWQLPSSQDKKSHATTKNRKFRSVLIPPVESIATEFDIRNWFGQRTKEALKEQAAGTNPLALIFPDGKGNPINLNDFSGKELTRTFLALGWKMPPEVDAKGKSKSLSRFTLHSLRDRFGQTAADEWGYTERQLLEQGSWTDPQTVRKFYLGTTDKTYEEVRELHNARKKVGAKPQVSSTRVKSPTSAVVTPKK
jgi:integrase